MLCLTGVVPRPEASPMLACIERPITVLGAVITVRESELPVWATIALSMLCILLVGFALRGEFKDRGAS